MKYLVVFITVSGRSEAKKIAGILVKDKLAACVNLVNVADSVYRWKGKIEHGKEVLLIAKTGASKIGRLVAAVKRAHSYTVPEVIALPIVGGNKDYLDWIDESLK